MATLARPPKRAFGSGSATQVDGQEPTYEEIIERFEDTLTSRIEDHGEKLLKTFSEANAKLKTEMAKTTITTVRAACEAQSKKIDKIEQDLAATNSRVDTHEREIQILKDGLSEAQKALRLASSTKVTEKELDAEQFVRPADLTILKVNTPSPCPKGLVFESVQEWLQAKQFADDKWTFQGPSEGMRWTIQFVGTEGLAATLSKSANQSLFDKSTGKWTDMYTKTWEKEGEKQAAVRIYIGPDKSDQNILLERLGKRMVAAVRTCIPNISKPVRATRPDEGAVYVTINGLPVLTIVAPARDGVRVAYDDGALEESGLDRAGLSEAFESKAPPTLKAKIEAAKFSF